MILKVLGSLLLGGGAMGALGGWLLVNWLDARRKQVRRVVSAPLRPSRALTDPEFAPGRPWPVLDPAEVQRWTPNWPVLRAEAHRHLLDPSSGFRPADWPPKDGREGNAARHP